jgi:thiol-disulfide isomerase/thioredoxin
MGSVPLVRLLATLGLLLPLAAVEPSCSSGPAAPATSVGCKAPEIEGEDLDGVPFKLSDSGGKVVLLEFWGDGWGPCRALYGRTRALAEQHADAPFEVIGVNCDTQLGRLKLVMHQQKIGWRSFWNGPKGPSGPISRAWAVDSWPTLCVLDAKGVIRHRSNGANFAKIEELVERLLAELDPAVSAAK